MNQQLGALFSIFSIPVKQCQSSFFSSLKMTLMYNFLGNLAHFYADSSAALLSCHLLCHPILSFSAREHCHLQWILPSHSTVNTQASWQQPTVYPSGFSQWEDTCFEQELQVWTSSTCISISLECEWVGRMKEVDTGRTGRHRSVTSSISLSHAVTQLLPEMLSICKQETNPKLPGAESMDRWTAPLWFTQWRMADITKEGLDPFS